MAEIDIYYQGFAGKISCEDSPAAIKAMVAQLKAAGIEPLRRGFGGKPGQPGGQRPAPPAPVWDLQGRACCPDHPDSPLVPREKLGGKLACMHRDGEVWCRYAIAPEAVTWPTGRPASPLAAEQRFWAKYGAQLGVYRWNDLAGRLPGRRRPLTVEDWIAVAEQVRDQLAAA